MLGSQIFTYPAGHFLEFRQAKPLLETLKNIFVCSVSQNIQNTPGCGVTMNLKNM